MQPRQLTKIVDENGEYITERLNTYHAKLKASIFCTFVHAALSSCGELDST